MFEGIGWYKVYEKIRRLEKAYFDMTAQCRKAEADNAALQQQLRERDAELKQTKYDLKEIQRAGIAEAHNLKAELAEARKECDGCGRKITNTHYCQRCYDRRDTR